MSAEIYYPDLASAVATKSGLTDITIRKAGATVGAGGATIPANKTVTLKFEDSGSLGSGDITLEPGATLLTGATLTSVDVKDSSGGTIAYNPTLKGYSLSTAANVTAITPSGTISGTTITASVANGVSSQTISATVSPNATWKLYSDASCSTEITNKVVSLSVGSNTFYIKVTAPDGTTTKTYTLTITRASSGGGSYSGGGSSGGGTSTPPPATDTPDEIVVNAETTATKNEETGAVNTTLTTDAVTKAFDTTDIVVGVTISIPSSEDVTAETPVEATIARDAIDTIANNSAALIIESPALTISFDADAVDTIAGAGSGDVVISAGLADTSALTDEQQTAAGDRPVYSFSVTSGGTSVSNLGGTATVSLPYDLKPGEDPNAIVICYIDAQGNLQSIPGGVYDAATGKITFAVTHFSLYMINYNPVAFSDTTGHWASDSITFVAARELFSGIGDNNFSPNTSMTRAMFATVLAKLDGADTSRYTSSRFSDVSGGTWYTGGVEWAAEKGIVTGVGDNKFDPNTSITREQMAVMLGKYLSYKQSALPSVTSAITFGDDDRISSWAKSDVTRIQRAGIITGRPGNLFDPQGIATRAEVATVFARFIGAMAG